MAGAVHVGADGRPAHRRPTSSDGFRFAGGVDAVLALTRAHSRIEA